MGKGMLPKQYIVGKYAVGTKCFSIVDADRREVLGDGTGNRRIPVRMYYPVNPEDVEGKPQARIFSKEKLAAVKKAYALRSIPEEMQTAAFYEDAPVSQEEKFPLILFSMGYRSYVESNTYLLCALASQGYIIASVGHAYEAVRNEYTDGTGDLFDPGINKLMYTNMVGALFAQYRLMRKKMSPKEALTAFEAFQNKYTPYFKGRLLEWQKDAEKALDEVKRRYGDCIDTSHGIGAAGHSLGGCLAYYLCRYGEAFSCGINMDGGFFGDYPDKIMEKPFCQIGCRESINAETRACFDTNADTYYVLFDDMKHIGFTDAKFFMKAKAFVGTLDPDEMFRHLVYTHRTFFDRYLKGKEVTLEGLPGDKVEYKRVCSGNFI